MVLPSGQQNISHFRRIRVAESVVDRKFDSVEDFMNFNDWARECDLYLKNTHPQYFWILSPQQTHLYLIVKYIDKQHKDDEKPIWREAEEQFMPYLHNGWGRHKNGDGTGRHFKDSKYYSDYDICRKQGEKALDPKWCIYE